MAAAAPQAISHRSFVHGGTNCALWPFLGNTVQRISPVECAMLFGVAVIVTSLVISTLAAVVVDTTYQAIAERRWPAGLPFIAIALTFVAVAAVA